MLQVMIFAHNWKATVKNNQLMVNQYIDERSQPIYSIIDKGRTMETHFEGLSLLDYAINAALAVSNAALKKQDKAGCSAFWKGRRSYHGRTKKCTDAIDL